MRGKGFKFIGCGHERKASQFGNFGRNAFVPTHFGVKTRSHSCAALGQFIYRGQGRVDSSNTHCNLMRIAREFLAQGQRSGVLGMCAADFDDIFKSLNFFQKGCVQFFKPW